MSIKSLSVKTPKGVQASIVDLSNLSLGKRSSARVGNKLTKAVLTEYAASDSGAGIFLGGNLGKLGGKFDPWIWGGIWMDRIDGIEDISKSIEGINL